MTDQANTCQGCGAPITAASKTRHCRSCWAKSPQKREATRRKIKLKWQDPATRAAWTEAAAKTLKRPDIAAKRAEGVKRNRTWETASRCITPEQRAKGGQRGSATKLAHIPRELRDDYRALRRSNRLSAAEAAALILEQHERDMRRFVEKITKRK